MKIIQQGNKCIYIKKLGYEFLRRVQYLLPPLDFVVCSVTYDKKEVKQNFLNV
jgi:hypothetical protein